MGAAKRLADEYRRSGWNLSGFPPEERPTWRRLLPESLASPRVVAIDDDLTPVAARPRRPTFAESVAAMPPMSRPEPPFDPTPEPTPTPAPTFYRVEDVPRKPPATNQSELF